MFVTWNGGFWRWSGFQRYQWSSLGFSGCPALWADSLLPRCDLDCPGSWWQQRDRSTRLQNQKTVLFHLSAFCKNRNPFRVTHYWAESFSWYSRARLKHSWVPASVQTRVIAVRSSAEYGSVSSIRLTTSHTSLASAWTHTFQKIRGRGTRLCLYVYPKSSVVMLLWLPFLYTSRYIMIHFCI